MDLWALAQVYAICKHYCACQASTRDIPSSTQADPSGRPARGESFSQCCAVRECGENKRCICSQFHHTAQIYLCSKGQLHILDVTGTMLADCHVELCDRSPRIGCILDLCQWQWLWHRCFDLSSLEGAYEATCMCRSHGHAGSHSA